MRLEALRESGNPNPIYKSFCEDAIIAANQIDWQFCRDRSIAESVAECCVEFRAIDITLTIHQQRNIHCDLMINPKKRAYTESVSPSSSNTSQGTSPGTSPSVSSHPFGVQPLGNIYFNLHNYSQWYRRSSGNFTFHAEDHSILLYLLSFCAPLDLIQLSHSSGLWYVIANHDDLWRKLVLERYEALASSPAAAAQFSSASTWRETYGLLIHRHPEKGTSKQGTTENGTAKDVKRSRKRIQRLVYSDVLYQPFHCAHTPLFPRWLERETVPRESTSTCSASEFITRYECPNRPVIFTDIVTTWKAYRDWDIPYLKKLSTGQTYSAGGFQMTLDSYLEYATTLKDDQPLTIFDSTFSTQVPEFAQEYDVPEMFAHDFFAELLPAHFRPKDRWLIIGPARSGSSFHVDPNATSAFNAVLRGKKKWMLFPPHITPPGVFPNEDQSQATSPVSIVEWFLNFYDESASGLDRPLECIVHAGEMIFVPRGWWHCVLNLEDCTVAITHNFVTRANVSHVLEFLEHKTDQISGLPNNDDLEDCPEANFAATFREQLQLKYPELYTQAREAMYNRQSLWTKMTSTGPRARDESRSTKRDHVFAFDFY